MSEYFAEALSTDLTCPSSPSSRLLRTPGWLRQSWLRHYDGSIWLSVASVDGDRAEGCLVVSAPR